MVRAILGTLTDDEYKNMKAAYMIGMGLDDQALNDPHIKPAAGEFDKGVTVSFKYDGMELTNHVDPETHVLLVDGFDFVTHPSVSPGCSPRWPEHNLHVYEVRMYAPFLRKNIKDRAYRSVH